MMVTLIRVLNRLTVKVVKSAQILETGDTHIYINLFFFLTFYYEKFEYEEKLDHYNKHLLPST